jgi:hypothetical protein
MTLAVKTYSFIITVAGTYELTDDIANALYEAGCDDGGGGTCDGVLTIEFDREAESLGDAIGSAIKNVQAAGYAVARVDVETEGGRSTP